MGAVLPSPRIDLRGTAQATLPMLLKCVLCMHEAEYVQSPPVNSRACSALMIE